METEYIRPEKSAEKCMRITGALVLCPVMIAATLLVLLALDAGVLGGVILAVCWVLVLAYIIFATKVRYKRYMYCIDSEAIRVRKGLFWISESIVPIERLHKIEVSQGPLARMFKMSTVCVTTAGGAVNIKFLNEKRAGEISEALKTKINSIALSERARRLDE